MIKKILSKAISLTRLVISLPFTITGFTLLIVGMLGYGAMLFGAVIYKGKLEKTRTGERVITIEIN